MAIAEPISDFGQLEQSVDGNGAIELVEPVAVLETAGLPQADERPLVEHFYESLGEDTRRGYRFDLGKFAAWQGLPVDDAVASLLRRGPGAANRVVFSWVGHMRERGLSPATRNRRLAAIKSVLRFARLVGVIDWNIDVRGARVEKFKDTRGPGLEIASNVIRACNEAHDELAGVRDRAMLMLALRGLRRRELTSLERQHIDFQGQRVFVKGKGEKDEWVEVSPEIVEALQAWLGRWDSLYGKPADAFVFRSMSHRTFGKRISRKGVYVAVVNAGTRAGVKIWTHGLRHTGITAALDETNGNIRAGQKYARHSDPRITMHYDDNRTDQSGEIASRIMKKIV